MAATIFSFLLVLLQLICVIVVVACLLTMSRFFIDLLNGHHPVKRQFLLILRLGILSTYGTVSGVKIPGALVNMLDLGPRVTGIIGGPVIGKGAGLIETAYPEFPRKVPAIPCFLASIPVLLSGGIIWLGYKWKFCVDYSQSDDIKLMVIRVK